MKSVIQSFNKSLWGLVRVSAMAWAALAALAVPEAQAVADIAVGSTDGRAGQTGVLLPVTLTDHGTRTITALWMELSFDITRLVFQPSLTQAGAAAIAADKQVLASSPSPGQIRVVIFGLNQTVIGEGELIRLDVDLLPAAPSGIAPVTFVSAMASNAVGQAVPTTMQSGTIQVTMEGSLAGTLHYYSNSQPVGNATVLLQGTTSTSTQTAATGAFSVSNLSPDTWQLEPRKSGGANDGISSLDAVYVLQSALGLKTLAANQQLACDVTGDGTLSAFDAALILRYTIGLITQFPIAQTCGSDWVFVPTPTAAPNQQLTQPLMNTGSCQRGAISYQPLPEGAVSGQDFTAVLFGDCTGNWQPQ